MRYRNIFCILFLLATYVSVSVAAADTRYVVDELVITLRQGKSTKHKIIETLKTGSKGVPQNCVKRSRTCFN